MWLVGMMGSGKTSVGRGAAARLRMRFYDTDAIVEDMAKSSIDAIWDRVGEAGFRELERRAVATVPVSGAIAAAGGGAILDPVNRELIRRGRLVVWLRGSPHLLASRLSGDDARPLLCGDVSKEERLAQLLRERSELYSEVATDHVDTDDKDVDEVTSEVVEIWRR